MSKRKVWFIVLSIILFIMVAIFVKSGILENFESWTYKVATENMCPTNTNIMKLLTCIGDSPFVIICCLVLLIISKTRKKIFIPVSLTLIVSAFVNMILKNLFARQRPDVLRLINETDYSFPSGHAMNNSALYTILILLTFRYMSNKLNKISLSFLFILITIGIGYSRIYLGVHYAGDILGGWLLGFLIAIIVYHFCKSVESTKDKQNEL